MEAIGESPPDTKGMGRLAAARIPTANGTYRRMSAQDLFVKWTIHGRWILREFCRTHDFRHLEAYFRRRSLASRSGLRGLMRITGRF